MALMLVTQHCCLVSLQQRVSMDLGSMLIAKCSWSGNVHGLHEGGGAGLVGKIGLAMCGTKSNCHPDMHVGLQAMLQQHLSWALHRRSFCCWVVHIDFHAAPKHTLPSPTALESALTCSTPSHPTQHTLDADRLPCNALWAAATAGQGGFASCPTNPPEVLQTVRCRHAGPLW